jgi:hypothetical protein
MLTCGACAEAAPQASSAAAAETCQNLIVALPSEPKRLARKQSRLSAAMQLIGRFRDLKAQSVTLRILR